MTDPATDPATVPTVTLNNGVQIPQLGFGVFKVDPAETAEAVQSALAAGYRHIDTAQMYGNESGVGEGIRASGIDPGEIFVTSKLNNNQLGYDAALSGFDETLQALKMDSIDLFLIHWPLPSVRDFVDTWRAFEKIYNEGRVRSIGVSNFHPAHLQRLFDETDIVPAVNQIEVHPYLTQNVLRAFNADHGIATESWSPIARGRIAGDEVIEEIGGRHGKSAAQVTLRWHLQLGCIVFPKSISPQRMKENFEIFDFELSDHEVSAITALDRGERTGPDPDTFDWVP